MGAITSEPPQMIECPRCGKIVEICRSLGFPTFYAWHKADDPRHNHERHGYCLEAGSVIPLTRKTS